MSDDFWPFNGGSLTSNQCKMPAGTTNMYTSAALWFNNCKVEKELSAAAYLIYLFWGLICNSMAVFGPPPSSSPYLRNTMGPKSFWKKLHYIFYESAMLLLKRFLSWIKSSKITVVLISWFHEFSILLYFKFW